jgi:uncharacterized membrane protein
VSETVHTGISENSLGAVSYLTLIPAIVFLAIAPYNRSAYVRFHSWQSIIVGAIAFLVNFVLSSLMQSTSFVSPRVFLTLSALIGVAYMLVMIFCAVRALNGKLFKLPLVGAWAERQANR